MAINKLVIRFFRSFGSLFLFLLQLFFEEHGSPVFIPLQTRIVNMEGR